MVECISKQLTAFLGGSIGRDRIVNDIIFGQHFLRRRAVHARGGGVYEVLALILASQVEESRSTLFERGKKDMTKRELMSVAILPVVRATHHFAQLPSILLWT